MRIRDFYLFADRYYASIDNDRFHACDNYCCHIFRLGKDFIEYMREVRFEDMV
jgi:hypothetical protein